MPVEDDPQVLTIFFDVLHLKAGEKLVTLNRDSNPTAPKQVRIPPRRGECGSYDVSVLSFRCKLSPTKAEAWFLHSMTRVLQFRPWNPLLIILSFWAVILMLINSGAALFL